MSEKEIMTAAIREAQMSVQSDKYDHTSAYMAAYTEALKKAYREIKGK